ncbi:MAG: hypothetical protein H0V02_02350 [Nocardioidaceae bacterium]|nr:hypothetical protein [Nocardioidaceae bacterium]
MTAIYIHNTPYASQQEARDRKLTSKALVRFECWWHLWKIEAWPFKALGDGDLVVLLSTWRGCGELTWLVKARDVHKHSYGGWANATEAIANWGAMSVPEVRSEMYTSAKRPSDPGVVLAWKATPVKALNTPRPLGLRLRPTGWLLTDAATLKGMGVPLP